MLDPNKLFQLSPGQKRRKLALSFGALERDIAGIAEAGTEYQFSSMSRAEYEKALCEVLLKDTKLNPASAKKSANCFRKIRRRAQALQCRPKCVA